MLDIIEMAITGIEALIGLFIFTKLFVISDWAIQKISGGKSLGPNHQLPK